MCCLSCYLLACSVPSNLKATLFVFFGKVLAKLRSLYSNEGTGRQCFGKKTELTSCVHTGAKFFGFVLFAGCERGKCLPGSVLNVKL